MPRIEPQRSCLGCRQVKDKGELLRFVLAPDRTLVPDLQGKLPGRGAYTCPKVSCLKAAAEKKQFARSFKGEVRYGTAAQLIALVAARMEERIGGYLALANKAGKVASGGEVSRIMLALKSILAKSDRLPVLIFDEIDVGVSGRIAQAVGKSLKALSGFHQVIAITHLPQIAGLADTHFMVSKAEKEGRATTSIRTLSLDEQVQEVARLMSGAEVTQAGLAGARELMGLSK